ncbi:CMRF35-like molecule 1 isoform X2 [Sebastes umbrosus]|uniref:CMRF35-like molecule 1 isoform X2 n=1 Tax=Sebastes umbrosus TaxID=72105 RepID=UPI00189FF9AD|nr:CMRF35-like molecule 1 isoform X2 [Sebastes umbrosus]
MAVYLSFLLILTGLTGIHSITTVSKMSVKAGDSVTIPCLYDSKYTNHVKYLCKGYRFDSCSYAVKTNQQNSEKFSISDDKEQRIFTVTIKDLKDEDTDYWCAVEIKGGSDVREYFQLLVTKRDTPRLYVDHQEITGFNGEEVTINCQHRNRREIAWCRLGSSCVMTSSGSIDGTRVTISMSVPNVFTVTMSGLRTESSGWYWCVKGDLQMPVHVTVTERPTTLATTRQLTTVSPTSTRIPITGDGTTVKNGQGSASIMQMILIISLSLLISIAIVAVFVWFMLKRHKRTKVESSATTTAEEEVTYSDVKLKRKTSGQAGEEVTYGNVGYMRKTSGQSSYAEGDMDVMYSSVVAIKKQTGKRV